jgi:hypothetical protein
MIGFVCQIFIFQASLNRDESEIHSEYGANLRTQGRVEFNREQPSPYIRYNTFTVFL